LLAVISLGGAALLVVVYQRAYVASPNYNLFWLAMACMFAPLWLMGMSSRFSRNTALGSIVAIGLASYLPAFLRAPNRPLFGDALGHYLSVENTLRTGNLFAPNPVVPVAAYYPGLHALTASLVKLSGAPIWDVAVLLLALMHVSTLLGVYALGFTLSGSSRAAATAAIIYGVSPQFGFFDSQFAYESLAVPLLVWTVALLLYALDTRNRRVSSTLLGVSAALGLCCVITHHLTSYVLAALLILIGLSQLAVGERRSARPALGIGLLLGVAAAGWVLLTKAPIISYLGYFPRTAFDAVGPIFRQLLGEKAAVTSTGGSGGSQTRSLFTGSTLPLYEHLAAYTVQVIAAVASLLAGWRLRRSRSGALLAFGVLAASYFVLLPLRFNLAGEQGALRLSTFQWIGIAVVVATGLVAEPRRRPVGFHSLGRRPRFGSGRQRPPRPAVAATAVVVLFVSLVGNYGSAVNAAFRFPGAFELNSSDGRDTPIEAVKLAQRFLSAEGPGRSVVSDVATERVFETYAFTVDLGAFPQWEFFLPDFSSQQLESLARSGGIDAIVVDDRDAEGGGTIAQLPGYPPAVYSPITTAGLERLSSFTWLKVMYRTEHYVVLTVVGEG
jgi:4-amino-4-deoxy-L-arabinose transferase-like glycosyltransferase